MSNKKIRESLWNWFRAYNREPFDENKTSKALNDTEAATPTPSRNVDRFDNPHVAWRAYKRIAPNGGYFDAMNLWDFTKWLFAEAEGDDNGND